jgi:tetratricopeptide (TPR) repeat protein
VRDQALELATVAERHSLACALYQLGIVFLMCEDVESADRMFQSYRRNAKSEEEKIYAGYGTAAVFYNRKDSAKALAELDELEPRLASVSADLGCLVYVLQGNCQRSLGRYEESLASYAKAQAKLPRARAFYLKNWVFFGLGTALARKGETTAARTLFQIVLSITHPTDFKRLHKLTTDELLRLEMKVEVLFDPVTGDVVSNRGCLSLRRKPTLISILGQLIEYWPNAISKELLYCRVWGGDYHPLRHDGLIYSHMQRLRQILFADMKLGNFILTTQDGYRLNPDISVRVKESPSLDRPVCAIPQEVSHELR